MSKSAEKKAAAKAAETSAEPVTPSSDRNARWEAFLEQHEKQNPEKFAIKKARGEYDKIPDTFV